MKHSLNPQTQGTWRSRLGWFGLALVMMSRATLADGTVAADETPVPQDPAAQEKSEQGLDPDNLPAEMSLSLEQLLNDPEGIAPDVDSTRCLRRKSGFSTEILDTKHLLFKSSVGNRAWLNRLKNECVGLRPEMFLVFESAGGRLCQLDTVFGSNSSGFPGIQSAHCLLGPFEPITMEHAEALEETFRLRSKAIAESRRQERRAARTERKRKRQEAREARKAARDAAG